MKIRVGDIVHVTKDDGESFVTGVYWHDTKEAEVGSGNRTIKVPLARVKRYFRNEQQGEVFKLAFTLAQLDEPIVEGYRTCALCSAYRGRTIDEFCVRQPHEPSCPWATARKLLGMDVPA